MKKLSLSYFGDLISVSFISFALSFILFNYFLDKRQTFLFSICLCVIFTLLFGRILYVKRVKKDILGKDAQHFNSVITQLNYTTRTKNDELFYKALKSLYPNAILKKQGTFLSDKNTLIVTRFGFDEVKKSDVIKAFNLLNKDESVQIYAESFNANVIEFATRFNGKIILKDGKEAYNLLKKADVFPDIKFELDKQKKTKIYKFSNVFSKKRAKTFLGFGICFLFMSYFVPLKTYYVICATVMLIFSGVLILFGQKEPTKN